MKIVWDEANEFARFEGSHDEIPDHAWEGRGVAAVIMNGMQKFTEPVWLHKRAAQELWDAGILEPFPDEVRDANGVAVIISKPVNFDGCWVDLYVGPL